MPAAPARADGLRGTDPPPSAVTALASSLAGAVVPARSLLLAPSPTPGPGPRRPGPGTVPGAPGVPGAASVPGAAPVPGAATGPTAGAVGAAWPLPSALGALLPGGLRRGSTVRVEGSTSLLLALMAEASAVGAWCGVVGLPSLNAVAAEQTGVDLDRLALVPHPRESWPTVVAALLDAVDLVAVAPPAPSASPSPLLQEGHSFANPPRSRDPHDTSPDARRPGPGTTAGRATATVARRLSARARERRGVLLVVGGPAAWVTADVELTAVACRWDGLGQGHGHLRERSLDVQVTGRRTAAGRTGSGGSRPRTVTLDLPAPSPSPLLQEGHSFADPPRSRDPHDAAPDPPPDAGPSGAATSGPHPQARTRTRPRTHARSS